MRGLLNYGGISGNNLILSSVGIAPDYELDGPGSNPGRDDNFPSVQTGPEAHPASCTMGTGSFPGGRGGRGVRLTPHPHLVLKFLEKSRALPLLTLRACVAYKKG